MKNIYKVEWSLFVWIVTILASMLLIFVTTILSIRYMETGASSLLIGITLIPVGLLLAVVFTPRRIVIEELQITLYRMMGKVHIPYTNIKEIRLYKTPLYTEFRLLGSGGLFGFVGFFYSKNLGYYMSYVGDVNQAFLIKTKEGKTYVLSCEDNLQLIKYLESKLSTHTLTTHNQN